MHLSTVTRALEDHDRSQALAGTFQRISAPLPRTFPRSLTRDFQKEVVQLSCHYRGVSKRGSPLFGSRGPLKLEGIYWNCKRIKCLTVQGEDLPRAFKKCVSLPPGLFNVAGVFSDFQNSSWKWVPAKAKIPPCRAVFIIDKCITVHRKPFFQLPTWQLELININTRVD